MSLLSSSSVPQPRGHVLSLLLSSLLQEEKENTQKWLRDEMDRLVDPMLDSIFQRLTNKLVGNDKSGGLRLGGGTVSAQMDLLNYVESPNPHLHRSATLIAQPSTSSTSSFNPHSHRPPSTGYEPEYDPEILAQVKREIKEEEMEMALKNVLDNTQRIEDYEMDSTLEDGQLSNQTIDDDHQPNGQVNNVTDNDTEQKWDKPEIEEGGHDAQTTYEQNQIKTHNPGISLTNASPNSNDDEEEYDPEILAQVKREIKEEENEMKLQNMMGKISNVNGQIEDGDENEEYASDQVGHIAHHVQLGQVETLSPSTDDHLIHNTDLNEQIELPNQTIDDDHQLNRQVNNATDTQQDLDKLVEEEGEDEQIMHIEEEEVEDGNRNDDDETEIEEMDEEKEENKLNDTKQLDDKTNNREMMEIEDEEETEIEDNEGSDEDESQTIDIAPIETTLPNSNEQTLALTRHSARHLKRKQSNKVSNQEETEKDDDNEEEVTPRSVKRTRPSRSTTSNSTGNPENQVITVTLQCPQCDRMFAKNKFKKHLKEEHSIGPVQCLVKDCAQSFDSTNNLHQHRVQSHRSTSQWHCGKCDHQFPSYPRLSHHNTQQHQLGDFQCSFPACTFTGEYRQKVFSHYTNQHK